MRRLDGLLGQAHKVLVAREVGPGDAVRQRGLHACAARLAGPMGHAARQGKVADASKARKQAARDEEREAQGHAARQGKVADASKARKQAARDEEREAQAVHGLAAMQQGGNQ